MERQLRVYTPSPRQRERERGESSFGSELASRARSLERQRQRQRELAVWDCSPAGVNVALCLAPKERSAGRLAQFENDGSGCRASRPSSFAQDTHAVSVSPQQTIFHTGRSTNPDCAWDLPISSQTGNRTSPLRPALSRELPQARMYSVCKDQNQRLDRDSQ